jgi:hypothetical protein
VAEAGIPFALVLESGLALSFPHERESFARFRRPAAAESRSFSPGILPPAAATRLDVIPAEAGIHLDL